MPDNKIMAHRDTIEVRFVFIDEFNQKNNTLNISATTRIAR